ncbi:ceramide-1-phosphate transfer protein [Aethina tumida]|uniref:ceramide-1-phosphate transfer protein n=1 Tax=Aethina tumida TaxID=116153 RepID=UPI00096B1B4B|nr:ceramide-1-phosphate transfer protein [Aethina tumida]
MSNENVEFFNLEVVYNNLKSAQHEDEDVKMELYLLSYEELNKFFTLIGTIFGFVSKDLQEKMGILQDFLKNEETSEHFQTVKGMIEYEKNNNLLTKKGYTSGSRTLLRLHRGLDFILQFLKKLNEIKDDEDTCYVCRDAYNETLAKHHPFLIRNGAKIAIYTLPKRQELLNRVCGTEEHIKNTLKLFPETLQVINQVFDRVDKIYTDNDLHSLP